MNRFFMRVFAAIDGTFARAAAVRNEYTRIEQGFDAVQAELDGVRPTWLPTSLVGNALKILRCNAGETAIEFVNPGRLPIVAVSASRSLVGTDVGRALVCSSASAINLTVEPFATSGIEVESTVFVGRMGAGAVTLVAGSGVTLRSADSLLSARAQYSQLTLLQVATNEWLVGGDRG